jgi:hypothetical protein
MRLKSVIAIIITAFIGSSIAQAESVFVKYRGEVDLKPFECTATARSSFINRVCYDHRNDYMLISLNGTFYHYCEIPTGTVSSLLNAPSMGRPVSRAISIAGCFECPNTEILSRVFRCTTRPNASAHGDTLT